MDWVVDHAWECWLGLALVLAIAEVFSLDLVLLMLAIGALAGVACDLAGASFVWQCIVAAVVALALLVFVRPRLVRRLATGTDVVSGAQGLVGTTGLVVEAVTDREGLVQLDGGPWTARTEGASIPAGMSVRVTEIRGATAYVEESS